MPDMRRICLSESSLHIAVENGWYHVLNRGIDGRQLFPDDHANEHFLELLESVPERFGLRIHAFVLMGNHYHLQIETLKPELSRAIQWLNLLSGWYNRFCSLDISGRQNLGKFENFLWSKFFAGLERPVRVMTWENGVIIRSGP